jgi:glycosyltransferase involved in cell wall biosynthesis
MVPDNKLIKVVMIIQDYIPRVGGAERQLFALTPLLKERGVEVEILTRRYPGLAQFERINDVPVYRLPFSRSKTIASLVFTITSLPIIKKIQPDVIHAHGLLSPTTTAVAAKRFFGFPVVSKVLRGGVLGDLTRLINKPFGTVRFRNIQKQVDAFITISNEINDELIDIGVPLARCSFIPNGVKLDRFKSVNEITKRQLRKQLQLPDGLIVVFAGRLEAEKRIEDLIRVWPEIQLRHHHEEITLLVLGTGSLQRKISGLAGNNIIFRGAVDNISDYLQTSDLFVLPSVSEGLSNALLEALAVGLPVIATATGGTMDVVSHKVSGWLIQNYTPQSLRDGILEFIGDKSLREVCAKEGQRRVVEDYDINSTADKLNNLYRSLKRSLN